MRFIIFTVLLFAAAPAMAQSTPPAQQPGSTLGDIADVVFKEVERRVIKEYYDEDKRASAETDDKSEHKGKGKNKGAKGNGRGNGLPPGLAKREQLPPGLAKRGNQLPRGLMKGDLPPTLADKLPPPPENAERVIIDGDVLLIEKGTDIILDVIKDVITNQ